MDSRKKTSLEAASTLFRALKLADLSGEILFKLIELYQKTDLSLCTQLLGEAAAKAEFANASALIMITWVRENRISLEKAHPFFGSLKIEHLSGKILFKLAQLYEKINVLLALQLLEQAAHKNHLDSIKCLASYLEKNALNQETQYVYMGLKAAATALSAATTTPSTAASTSSAATATSSTTASISSAVNLLLSAANFLSLPKTHPSSATASSSSKESLMSFIPPLVPSMSTSSISVSFKGNTQPSYDMLSVALSQGTRVALPIPMKI
jgi:hypothetical protein